MFTETTFEERMASWSHYRNSLEIAENPIKSAFKDFSEILLHSLQFDPWNENTWPDPWTLIDKNKYCAFSQILFLCYTLQLIKQYKQKKFSIVIYQNHDTHSIEFAFMIDTIYYFDPTKNTNNRTILNIKNIPPVH